MQKRSETCVLPYSVHGAAVLRWHDGATLKDVNALLL